MASINNGTNAQRGDLPCAIAQWFASATLVNAAVQYLPMSGAASSLTIVTGYFVINRGIVIDTIYWQYAGDAANVGGQLLAPSISKYVGGVETVLFTAPGLATTAGMKNGSYTHTSPIELARGDVLLGRVTPSALLTAVCTNFTMAVG